MGKEQVTVLHIDSEKGWRGGQQQVAYLWQALHDKGYRTALVCQPESRLEKYALDKGLPYYPVTMRGEIDFIAGMKIASLCKKKGYRILHLHSSHALSIGLWTKLFYPKLKLIAVRRVDFHIQKNPFSKFKYQTKLLDKIVCISEGIKQVLRQDNIPDEKLITIHSGIDLQKFENINTKENIRAALGIPEHHIVVGTVAAMAGHKDYPNLLKAAEIVICNHEQVSFCAVGDGPEKENILRLADQLCLENRFIFAGFQNNIAPYLKTFDIFVLASKREGLGTSMLDAQAVGLPIVACKTGGIPEAVVHNKNGLLVPPGNENALADAISTLVMDEQLRKKLGEQAVKLVKKFNITVTVQKNIELYKNLLNNKLNATN